MSKKLSSEEYHKIKIIIIRKLYYKKAFEKGHLLYEHIATGVPSHLKGFVREVLEDLEKESLVKKYKRTKYGDAYQLNIKYLSKIERLLEQN